jgi:CheY-like chemotaxis protein
MSHELRTPLNAILGFAHILRDAEGLQAEHIQHLDIINRSGEHLLSVINAVLDLSRIESGVVSVELAPMDMAERVRDLVALMRPKAEAKKLNLRVSCDCPRLLRTDVTKLRQILFNLVGNSIKFTQKGSVSLRVVLLPAPEGMPPLLRIEVEDTGPGMTPEDQARIFEAFFQVAGLASTQGTGLGLPITRRYVELLGGKITCTSILGTGSIFRVELPVEFAVTQAAPPQVRKIKLAPGQPACRVLIVEDQPTNVLVLRHIMERVGFEVAVAENGALGVAAFRDWQPHWIWMDIMMPVMDGKEAARAIRALPGGREVKIVALTGCYLNEERADILAAGIDEVMGKPSSPPLLIECMQSHLDFKFINTETVAPPAAPEVLPPLPAGALSHLPEALRDELRTALFTLDAKKITAAAQALPPEAAAQAQLIIRHAQRLNYTALLQALDPVESGNAPA